MRCPSCEKFVGLELAEEPEGHDDLDIELGVVTGSIRIVRLCAECGDELKEANFDVEVTLDKLADEAHEEKGEHDVHEQSVEIDDCEMIEEGGGRYKKSYYGVKISFTGKCSCGVEESGSFEDKVPASGMDELV